jgi:hypothetical protein
VRRRGVFLFSVLIALVSPVLAEFPADLRVIDVQVSADKSHIDPMLFAAFFAAYLGNVKGYNLAADGMVADAVLEVEVDGFGPRSNSGRGRFYLRDAAGKLLLEWEAGVEAPAFDPPWQRQARPYGNLDEVFAVLPARRHSLVRTIRVMATTDQAAPEAIDYLRQQVSTASQVLERDFGIRLQVDTVQIWEPRYDDVFTIARAANALPGRAAAELTLVTLGPPAPLYTGGESEVLGYARVLADVLVCRVMNARVFVHEIAHALGAVHVAGQGCAMQPALWRPKLAGRFEFLPPVRFCAPNDSVIAVGARLPLGARFGGQQDKIAGLLAVYERLSRKYGEEVAPYRAELLLSQDRVEEAVVLLEEAIDARPEDRAVRAWLVKAYQRAGHHDQAQRLVEEVFEWRRNELDGLSDGRIRLEPTAVMSLSAATAILGGVSLGRQRLVPLVLANVGTAPFEITRLDPPVSPFSLHGAPVAGMVVAPGESFKFEVGFMPEKEGSYSGALTIFSDASHGGRAAVLLKGQGVWP